MLSQQQTIQLTAYADLYDKVVPQKHMLRQINDLIDFSFIYQELVSKYCPDNGRRAESPIRLFKYLLLKVIYDSSDVDVVERSMYDMSFKYFLGMSPEEDVINPSTLTKFRKLRLKDIELLAMLIGKTVEIAIAKGIIKTSTIIVDATHSGSRSNPYSPVQALKLRSKQLRKCLYEHDESIKETLPAKNTDDDLVHELAYTQSLVDKVSEDEILINIPKIKERLNMLKETLDDIQDHYTTSKDKDARVGHKTRDDHFFGYKSHIAMSPENIITAATVTSGEKGDGRQLPQLIEKTRKNGIEVKTVIGDTAYSGDSNLKQAKEEGFKIVAKVSPSISQGFRSEKEQWEYNKDAGMYVCPAGHMAIRKAKQGTKTQNPVLTYFFDIEKCKTCAFRYGCYKKGAKSKSYSITIKSETQTEQMAFQETPEFRELYRTERYKIEAKNAELKNVLGYDRAESYGMDAMQMQGAITMFAANVKRIIKLIGETK
jgi:transposase